MSLMPNFVEYPEYFSLFMIWASGYFLTYIIFGRSNIWKEIDGTMKVVIAMILGFAIEFCIILPFFYLWSFDNFLNVGLFLPALNNTWMLNCAFTFIFAVMGMYFGRKQILKFANLIFGFVFAPFFYTALVITFSLLIGYLLIYPDYIQLSTSLFLGYTIVMFVFFSVGLVFCLYFRRFTKKAYDEEIQRDYREVTFFNRHQDEAAIRLQRRLFVFRISLSQKINRFQNSRNLWFVLTLVIVMAFSIIPLDTTFGVFTPKVEYKQNIEVSHPENNLFLTINSMPDTRTPEVIINCSKIVYDAYLIRTGYFDRLGAVTVNLPSQFYDYRINVLNAYSGINSWRELQVFAPYPISKQLIITSPLNSQHLSINYSKSTENTFNLTVAHWAIADTDKITIVAQPIVCTAVNGTYEWKYNLRITNDFPYYLNLFSIQFDQYIGTNNDRNTTNVTIDGQLVPYVDIIENELALRLPQPIRSHETVTLEVSFLSVNSL